MINSVYNDPYFKHASKAITEIDVNLLAHPESLDGVRNFLDDCIKSPTKAMVAMKQVKYSSPRAPKFYYKNMALVKSIPEFSDKLECIKNLCKSNYKNTICARKLLVKFNRISFSKTVPRSKFINAIIKLLCLF